MGDDDECNPIYNKQVNYAHTLTNMYRRKAHEKYSTHTIIRWIVDEFFVFVVSHSLSLCYC